MKHRLVVSLPFSVFSALIVPVVSAQVPAGAEFRVNTHTPYYQAGASAASDAAGNLVVVWTSYGQDGDRRGVFGQRYDASGAPRGTEFQVNTYTLSDQFRPSVASGAAGSFVVTWTGYGQDGSSNGVFGRRFAASGAPQATEFQVNTYTTSYQDGAAVAADAAGNFVVAWHSPGQDGSLHGIFAQRFDASGARRGTEFQVNTFTSNHQTFPAIASDANGNFVVAWESIGQDGSLQGVFAQRFAASGARRGAEFQVNTFTINEQQQQVVASDAAGNFVVVWQSAGQDGGSWGTFAQRYDASGAPRGAEFQVNTTTTRAQMAPDVASDAAGNFVVVWKGYVAPFIPDIFAQRFDASGTRRGSEVQVNTYTTSYQVSPTVASDPAGNLAVAWDSLDQDGSSDGVFAQRFGGLLPAALAVDPVATGGSDGNSILEPGETPVGMEPSWMNVNGAAQTLDGTGVAFTGPAATGVSYSVLDAAATYGTVANGATVRCSDCYQVGVGFTGTRPAVHWDAAFTERLSPDAQGQQKNWAVHVGQSFTDVPKTSPFYRFVETLLHRGVTGGCTADAYCPASAVTREQMAPFVLVAREGTGYAPSSCTTPMFGDVPASSPFCRWIEELARRGVVAGCGGGNYCPASAVTREQMPVFVLRTLDSTLDPSACTTPVFADVPAASPFCRWIEELARRGVVTGCGSGNYCPTDPVTREQMGVFISLTFGLILYGP